MKTGVIDAEMKVKYVIEEGDNTRKLMIRRNRAKKVNNNPTVDEPKVQYFEREG